MVHLNFLQSIFRSYNAIQRKKLSPPTNQSGPVVGDTRAPTNGVLGNNQTLTQQYLPCYLVNLNLI